MNKQEMIEERLISIGEVMNRLNGPGREAQDLAKHANDRLRQLNVRLDAKYRFIGFDSKHHELSYQCVEPDRYWRILYDETPIDELSRMERIDAGKHLLGLLDAIESAVVNYFTKQVGDGV